MQHINIFKTTSITSKPFLCTPLIMLVLLLKKNVLTKIYPDRPFNRAHLSVFGPVFISVRKGIQGTVGLSRLFSPLCLESSNTSKPLPTPLHKTLFRWHKLVPPSAFLCSSLGYFKLTQTHTSLLLPQGGWGSVCFHILSRWVVSPSAASLWQYETVSATECLLKPSSWEVQVAVR